MDYLRNLHEICDTLSHELGEVNNKIRQAGGTLSAGDLEYIDKLTHSLKSVKTTIAMVEAEDDGGESGYYMPRYGSNNRNRGGSSYARRRDNMGRYTSRRGGMSYDDGMVEELHDLMERAPEESKRDFQKLIDKMEQM